MKTDMRMLKHSVMDYFAFILAGLFSQWLITAHIHGLNLIILFAEPLIFVIFLNAFNFYKIRVTKSSINLVVRAFVIMVPVTITIYGGMGFIHGFSSDNARWTLVYAVGCFIMLIGIRTVFRFIEENTVSEHSELPKAIVYGAGDIGTAIARQSAKGGFEYRIVGFIDDNEELKGEIQMGIPILGTADDLEQELKYDSGIQALIIAITNITSEKIQSAVTVAKKYGLATKIVPNLFESKSSADVSVRELDYADLLGRPLITIEKEPLYEMFSGKTILVTGAGGSIGSEICQQIINYGPKRLIVLDVDETELHDLCLRLLNYEREWSDIIVPVVCDIKNREKVRSVFAKFKPDLLFHAAAYKHVPLMELYPEEAILTNIGGSFNVFKAAKENGVKKTVVISTDKAVNPTNIMGATKRVVEMMAASFNKQCEDEKLDVQFCCVRFGNVIGSRGSMLPLFLEEIKAGRPVTVTHRKIIRYFMAIPEAVSLVFRAGSLANGGEVMVLDMGEPVNIYDFATKLVNIFGDGRSYVKVVGLRPGEKLYEELLANKDNTIPTVNERIFKAKVSDNGFDMVNLSDFISKMPEMSCDELVAKLEETVPEFHRKK